MGRLPCALYFESGSLYLILKGDGEKGTFKPGKDQCSVFEHLGHM
jgi:hypothetical protein